MPEFHVSWTITAPGNSPREALDWVVKKMRGETVCGWTPEDDVFEVVDARTGEKTTIDLEEDGEPCAS